MVVILAGLASLAVILATLCGGAWWLYQRMRDAIRARDSQSQDVEELQAEVADLKRQISQRGAGGKQRSGQAPGRRNGQPGIERGAPFQVALANGMATIRSSNKSGSPVLKCTLAQWRDFLDRAKRGEFDVPR
jgi:hypothetical protein